MKTVKHIFATFSLITALALPACQNARSTSQNPSSHPSPPASPAPCTSTPDNHTATTADQTSTTASSALPTAWAAYGGAAFALFGQLPDQPSSSRSPLDNLRQVTFTVEGDDFDPDVDPTGRWLVFSSTRHRHTSDIYLQQVDGSAVIQLTSDPANDAMPVFSPDGSKIAFCSDRAGNWNIYIMPREGGQPVQLTDDPGHEIHPSFSPDGRWLVYCSLSLNASHWELVVIEVDRPSNKIYLGPGLFPRWSPVDNRIVYQKARQRGSRWFSIWTIEFVNGEGVRPTEIAASTNAACITPAWSPDGRHIVFCTVVEPETRLASDGRPEQADIWIVAADGSARANLTANHAINVQPTWARDGTVYFVSSRLRSGSQNIWAIRPERALTVSPATARSAPAATPAATDQSKAALAPAP